MLCNCCVCVILALNCHATRHGNKYFRNGECPEHSSDSQWKFYNPQAVIHICPMTLLSSQPPQDGRRCMSCHHTGTLVKYGHGSFLFSIFSDSDFLTSAHPSPVLCRQGREERFRRSLLSNSFTATLMAALGGVNGTVCNAQQYRQSLQSYGSLSPSISCLTHGEIIGLVVSISISVYGSTRDSSNSTVGSRSVAP